MANLRAAGLVMERRVQQTQRKVHRLQRENARVKQGVVETRQDVVNAGLRLDNVRDAVIDLRDKIDAMEAQLPLPRPRVIQEEEIEAITNLAGVKLYLKTLLPREPQ